MKRKKSDCVGAKSQKSSQCQSSPAKRLEELKMGLTRLRRSNKSRSVKVKEFEELCQKARGLCDDQTLKGFEAINYITLNSKKLLMESPVMRSYFESVVSLFFSRCNRISEEALDSVMKAQKSIFGDDDRDTHPIIERAFHYSGKQSPCEPDWENFQTFKIFQTFKNIEGLNLG